LFKRLIFGKEITKTMANKQITMLKIKQLIRLKIEGRSNREISQLLHLHRTTVRKYLSQAATFGPDYRELLEQEESFLHSLFNPPRDRKQAKEKMSQMQTFFSYMENELKRTGVDKQGMWMEYAEQHPQGYTYSHFCREYKRWKKKQDVSMPQEHKAGDKVYVDFTGETLPIVDRQTGEVKQAEVLVCVLGCSQLMYVEATQGQSKEHFIGGIEHAFRYYGGVPKAIVPDNLKSAVTKPCKYEPGLNETFDNFAVHYGTVVLPARVRRPKDKALVENGVKLVYKRIFAPLRNTTFFSLADLNEAIQELLEVHNKQHFTSRDYSRRDLFERVEKAELTPLPVSPYELKKTCWLTVLKNSHIYLNEDKHYYSVPYQYVGHKLKVSYGQQVEIYHHGQRIAMHQRNPYPHRYTTIKEHMPSAHQHYAEWSAERYLNWASSIGTETQQVISKILQSKPHPEQAFRSCEGILHMAKKVGNERLNNACKRAIYYESYSYMHIKNILEKGLEKEPVQQAQYELPLHDNVRGSEYYQ
jgi:transposase